MVRNWHPCLCWKLHVGVGAYWGREKLCSGSVFAPPGLCMPRVHGKTAESLPRKSAYRNQIGSQRGHENFSRHPYGTTATGTSLAGLVKYQASGILTFSENSNPPFPFQTSKATRHSNIPFAQQGSSCSGCWGVCKSFQPRAPHSWSHSVRGHCISLLIHDEKVLWGNACIPEDAAYLPGRDILEVKILCRCYKE